MVGQHDRLPTTKKGNKTVDEVIGGYTQKKCTRNIIRKWRINELEPLCRAMTRLSRFSYVAALTIRRVEEGLKRLAQKFHSSLVLLLGRIFLHLPLLFPCHSFTPMARMLLGNTRDISFDKLRFCQLLIFLIFRVDVSRKDEPEVIENQLPIREQALNHPHCGVFP